MQPASHRDCHTRTDFDVVGLRPSMLLITIRSSCDAGHKNVLVNANGPLAVKPHVRGGHSVHSTCLSQDTPMEHVSKEPPAPFPCSSSAVLQHRLGLTDPAQLSHPGLCRLDGSVQANLKRRGTVMLPVSS